MKNNTKNNLLTLVFISIPLLGGLFTLQAENPSVTNQSLAVSTGQVFEIRLPDQSASTGYYYSQEPTVQPAEIATFISNKFISPQKGLLGAPGTRVYSFKASDSPAQGTIRIFKYKPGHQQQVANVYQYDIQVIPID